MQRDGSRLMEPSFAESRFSLATLLEPVVFSDLHFLSGTSSTTDPDARMPVWATLILVKQKGFN